LDLSYLKFFLISILLIDKPLGWTSNDVVAKVRILLRKYFGIPKIKVGHAGTLDPLATGLMVLCVGKKTREAMALTGEDKEYLVQYTKEYMSTHKDIDYYNAQIATVEKQIQLAYRQNDINNASLSSRGYCMKSYGSSG